MSVWYEEGGLGSPLLSVPKWPPLKVSVTSVYNRRPIIFTDVDAHCQSGGQHCSVSKFVGVMPGSLSVYFLRVGDFSNIAF